MLCLIFLDKKCCYDAGRDNDRDPEACVKRNRVAEEEVAEDCREDNRGVLKHRRHENILHAVGLRHAELSDGGRDAHAGEREEALHIDGGEAPVRDEVTDKAPECAEQRVVEHDSPGRLVQFRELPDLKPHKSGEKSRAETDKSRFDLSGFNRRMQHQHNAEAVDPYDKQQGQLSADNRSVIFGHRGESRRTLYAGD